VLCAIAGMGGAELSLLEVVSRLRDRYEFHLMIPGEGPFLQAAEAAGAKTWILPWPEALCRTGETTTRVGPLKLARAAMSLGRFTRQVSELLGAIDPGAFITNAVKAHVVGSLARRPKDIPLIWYMRDGLESRMLSRKILALLSRRCDLAVCISQYVLSQFREYISGSVPAEVVYNIVDLDRFRPGLCPAVDLPKGKDEIWFGIVGPITPLKGHDVFLEAAEKVAARLPNARFVVVGCNPYVTQAADRYEERLRSHGAASLGERVKFLGFRDDVPEVLAQMDVLVQSNRGPEGLGRSLLEAMACGVAVIAVNKWGPAELVQHGETGLLFAPLDADALAGHMLTLGQDAALRRSMGARAHAWMRENFVARKLAGEVDRILNGVIASQLQEAVHEGSTTREILLSRGRWY
jgi:glycosyltransferase involved in cell wall biosynthesis